MYTAPVSEAPANNDHNIYDEFHGVVILKDQGGRSGTLVDWIDFAWVRFYLEVACILK